MIENQEPNHQPFNKRIYCCNDMQRQLSQVCDQHANSFDCSDQLISYNPKFNEYGLIIHDSGSSSLHIHFCLWCGSRLPASLRDRWFAELEARGIEPFDAATIPHAYLCNEWYREEDHT